MSGHTLLRVNTGPLDGFFLSTDPSQSAFNYPGFNTLPNYQVDIVKVSPTQSGGFGGTTVYKLDLQADFIGKIVRKIDVSAISGNDGTYARFVDFLGHAISDEIKVKYGVNDLPKYEDLECNAWHFEKTMDKNEQDMALDLVAGGKSAAERDTLAASAQTLWVEVPLFWGRDPRMYLHQHSLAQELQLRFQNRGVAKLMDHDGTAGTPTATIDDEELHVFYYHVSNEESNMNTIRLRKELGVVYSIPNIQRIPQATVTSGSTTASIDLLNLNFPSRAIVFVARKKAEVTGAGGSTGVAPNDFYDYQPIDEFKITSSAGEAVHPQKGVFNLKFLQPKLFAGRPGKNVYVFNFAFDPADPMHSSGHLTIGGLNNPKLELTWDSAIGEDYVVDVFSVTQDILQASQGDLQLVAT